MSTLGKITKLQVPGYHTGFPLNYSALLLLSFLLLTGCSTTVTYESHSPAGLAKPAGYPIPVYTRGETVPRPCELIGTVSVGGGQFAMFGGSVETEMTKLMKTAWEKGADAVQLTSVEEPGFSRANYRLTANLLRYSDNWETIPVSVAEFDSYLKTNRSHLDPIEGVWEGADIAPILIGIMRNRSMPGRDFVAFVLNVKNPAWHAGYKKIDIRRGPEPGSYVFDYYLDNFSEVETTVILANQTAFSLMVPNSDEEPRFVSYSKIQ